jgi:hypothetical protein
MSLTKTQLRKISVDDTVARTLEVKMSIYNLWVDFAQVYLDRAAENGLFEAEIPSWTLSHRDLVGANEYFMPSDPFTSGGNVYNAIASGLTTCDMQVEVDWDYSIVDVQVMNPVRISWT